MTHPAEHIDDELLSALVDDQLGPDERPHVQAHLATCSGCQQRLEQLRAVATLLHAMPDVDPPRDFSLGPRLVADPPNVVRLQRWYTATRIAAGTLAAAWLVLSAGVLYIDSRPPPAVVELSQPRTAAAPSPVAQEAPAAPTVGVRAAAPAAAPQVRPTTGAGQPNPQSDDQVAAATSVNQLPTQVPTPQPTLVPRPLPPTPTSVAEMDASPLRAAEIALGIVTVVTLLLTLVVRHRLRQAASHP